MSSYSRSKKYGESIVNPTLLDNSDDESAARTRPFSFEDIMLRRKHKRSAADVLGSAGEGTNHFGRECIDKDITDQFETVVSFRHSGTLEESTKMSSRRKKEETLSDNMVVRRSDRDNHESGLTLMAKMKYDTNGKDKGQKNYHGNLDRGKKDQRSRNDVKNESGKRYSRDTAGKDRHGDRGGGKYERENKRKYQNGDKERSRDRNVAKKYDHGKHHVFEKLERKETKLSSSSHYEESRLERRRKRSQDREHKHRRSASLSPRAHKHSSKFEREKEVPLDSHVKKSRRWRFDGDGTGDATNNSSSQYKRHSGSTSGLGGYSPRKRRTESAIKTPPPVRSPEKKHAGWDLLPTEKVGLLSGSAPSTFQPSNPTTSSSINDLYSGAYLSPAMGKTMIGVSSNNVATKTKASLDLIQLTQATRPMRRLYIENLPHSASEKAVIDFLNSFLMSSGVNHFERTQPCISCIIHKDKGQALVEFLTPEDASAALSFDGSDFSGSILKIRRPKDFVEIVTGDLDKPVKAVNTISDVVDDSPNKIFIAGISNAISPIMLRDIVSAFGPLKAYHFGINEDLNEPCAFLEYVDESVMPKVCAGLNGMKIGGRVLKVFPAVSSCSSEHDGGRPCYGIPEHVKPLLQWPTVVLKLNNVFNAEVLPTLSELDIGEVLEDIRFECARFGTVKSLNVVKLCNTCVNAEEEYKNIDAVEIKDEFPGISTLQISRDENNLEDDKSNVGDCPDDGRHPNEFSEDRLYRTDNDDAKSLENLECNNTLDRIPRELSEQLSSSACEVEFHGTRVAGKTETDENDVDDKSMALDDSSTVDATSEKQAVTNELVTTVRTDLDAFEKSKEKDPDHNLESVFTLGTIFVEYGRLEAACMAAHSLHGRIYDGREISIEYVALDLYRKRFAK